MCIKHHLVKVFHLLAAFQFILALYETAYGLPSKIPKGFSFGGSFIHLTFLNGVRIKLHNIYLIVCEESNARE
jgi:hypothetical protein